MKKKTMTYVMTGALSFSILGSSSTLASASASSAGMTPHTENKTVPHKEGRQMKTTRVKSRDFSEVIRKQAEELGIDPEGKDLEALAKEVREMKLKQRASAPQNHMSREDKLQRWASKLGIETAGKEADELYEDILLFNLQKEASSLGLDPAGKDVNDLHKEIRHEKLIQTAERLNIETANKTDYEMMKQIRIHHGIAAAELEGFSLHKRLNGTGL